MDKDTPALKPGDQINDLAIGGAVVSVKDTRGPTTITVQELPGIGGYYLVAVAEYSEHRSIYPIHNCSEVTAMITQGDK